MGKGGERAEATEQASGDLQAVPLFADFLQEDFNATDFASKALAGSNATAQAKAEQLEAGIRDLKDRLAREACLRQDELLDQAAASRDVEGALQGITMAAESLQTALRRLRDEVVDPYESIQLKTKQLENLHAAIDLLRLVLQRLKLTQRLRTLAGPGKQGETGEGIQTLGVLDLGKAAKLLSDIAAVGQEADLSGVDVVTADDEMLDTYRQEVRMHAQAALRKGMDSLSQAEVGSALQVFYNLQELPTAVSNLVQSYLTGLESNLTAALDSRKLASGTGTTSAGLLSNPAGSRSVSVSGASVKVQEALWQKLAEFLERLHKSAVAVWHLQRVLAKKRDPLSHVLFLESLLEAGHPAPLITFWLRITASLSTALEEATTSSRGGVVRETLIHNFPRLAGLMDDVLKKIQQDTDVKGVRPAASAEEQDALLFAAGACQNAYLGAALSRMSDAVSAAFPGGNRALPTTAELHKCIGRLHEELKAVGDSPRLAALTAQAVGKALHLLAERAEYMAATGQELRNVTGACTSAQLRNITLCGQLQEVARSIASLLPRLPAAAATALKTPLETLEGGAVEAVMPLMRAAVERGEALLLKMHDHGFGSESTPEMARPSPYMLELGRHLSHCRVEYLSKFSPLANPQSASVGAALTQRFASRLLVFFVRHASLLRPLSQPGKLQLAKDIAELEEVVGANLWPMDQLGPPQRVLKAFRRLLFMETRSLAESPLLSELPPSVVLHHLYSRAPPALQSPHTRSGFTPLQYSLWLDQHSMADALKYIKAALEACASAAKSEAGYEEIYPLMHKLCVQKY